jgi:phosphotransferase system HPr (HPr) family protein
VIERRVKVESAVGLHARPAALFVRTAGGFGAQITVRNVTRGGEPVDAKSILGVLALGVSSGHEIEVTARGVDAVAAVEALREDPRRELARGAHPIGADPQPTGHRPAPHHHRPGERLVEQPIGVVFGHADHQPTARARPADGDGHVPAHQKGQPAEHALFGEVDAGELFAHPLGQRLIEGHDVTLRAGPGPGS